MRLRFLAFLIASLLCIFIRPGSTQAQTTATITGTLTDPSGAAVVGAKVVAEPIRSTEKPGSTQSGEDGKFSMTLAPGRYRVSIEYQAFARVEQEFALASGDARTWDVRLELERMSSNVVVTAAAEPTSAETAPAIVDVITREQINQRQELSVLDLLASEQGASFGRTGPFGGIASLFLDGGNSNYTKVLVDGTPVNEPGGAIDFSSLMLDDVDKIEIVHGASSALYGSDAMSGVVQIFTHRGASRTPELEFEGDGGTFGTSRGSGQLSGLLGAFDYSLGAGYLSTGGQGPNDNFRDTTLSGNLGWRFSDTNHLRLAVRNANSYAGQPGQTLLPGEFAPVQNAHLLDSSENLSWDFSTGAHWQHHLAGTEAYNRVSDLEYSPFGPTYSIFNQYNRAGFEGQSSYLFHNGSFTGGYDYEIENGLPDGPHERRNNQGGYFEARYQFGRRLSTTVGARAEDNASFGTRVVPRVGASYVLRRGGDFWGATRLRTSYGSGIKEPTFTQSFENDPCFPGNPDLKPERSTTFNAGMEQALATNRLRVSVDYFHNEFFDIISSTYNSTPTPGCPYGTGTFFNTDKARAYGANSSIEAKVTPWLRIAGNYTYDNSRVLEAPNAYLIDPTLEPGNRLFRRPLHSANLIANAHFHGMNWNLAGYYVGRRTDSDFDSYTVSGVCYGPCITSNPSYVRWDMATSFPLHHGLTATARVENLFNRRYQDAVGYPALGLNYRLGLRYTWGGE